MIDPHAVTIAFYHGNCLDGATGAAVLKMVNPAVVCVPTWRYSIPEHAPPVRGAHVVFIDITPTYLSSMAHVAKSVTVLDHHVSDADMLATMHQDSYRFDPHMCGAALVWQWVHGKDAPMPPLLRYIDALDRFDWTEVTAEDPDAILLCRTLEAITKPDVDTMQALLAMDNPLEYFRARIPIVMSVLNPQVEKSLRTVCRLDH